MTNMPNTQPQTQNLTINDGGPLSLETIRKNAPSIFVTKPAEKMSGRYSFVQTYDIIEKFMGQGWDVYSAKQTGRGLHSRHQVRIRNSNLPAVGDNFFEAVITNSHNGTSLFSINAGLFRLVCSNGLTVPKSIFGTINIRHKGFDVSEIRRITDSFAETMPEIEKNVFEMRDRMLTDEEKISFANEAMILRWPNDNKPLSITSEMLVKPNRPEDEVQTLWNVFNTVQENFVRGGINYRTNTGRPNTVRELRDIKSVHNVNVGLWKMAESYLCNDATEIKYHDLIEVG